MIHVTSENQTIDAYVSVVGSKNPCSFLEGKQNPLYKIVSSLKSVVNCTFSS